MPPEYYTSYVPFITSVSKTCLEPAGSAFYKANRKRKSLQPIAYGLQLIICFMLFNLSDAWAQSSDNREAAERPEQILRGEVRSETDGLLLENVSVKTITYTAQTDEKGMFRIHFEDTAHIIHFSAVGYQTRELRISDIIKNDGIVYLEPAVITLDETVVIGYGTTTRRMNTGSVSKISAKDIENQPVSNVLGVLQGRIAGLEITETSGMPGAGFEIRVRGQNSITQGSEPYIIVDGVPLNNGNVGVNVLGNATGEGSKISALNFLNPTDIESIEVLKDADATAIFGSKGANGVLIITTKKNKDGGLSYYVDSELRISTPSKVLDMMNTQEYLSMRKEAFENDGLTIDASNAPDLVVWDTTQYTDFSKLLIGNHATTHNTQFGLQAGNAQTNFRLNGAFNRESTVFPGQTGNGRATVGTSLVHRSADGRFEMNFSANYGRNKANFTTRDLTSFISQPPHLQLYDDDGNLSWNQNGISFHSLGLTNPLAYLNTKYIGKFSTLSSAMNISYRILNGLAVKVGLGYNGTNGSEISQTPSTAIDPASNVLPHASFAETASNGWLVEPQVQFNRSFRKLNVSILGGTTFQATENDNLTTNGYDYSTDMLLGSITGAGRIISSNGGSEYRYTALFGRASLTYDDTYVLNLTGRRDGSSRFGSGNRFANFTAVGAAWIVSNEEFFKVSKRWVSFAKIRGSYGSTGNDQIGDYQYLDSWSPSIAVYQNVPVLHPNRLLNPFYSWEVNKKLELALEWSMFNNRLSFSGSWYRNVSDNQLVNYRLPIQTGFPVIMRNLDAVVENTGWELELSGVPLAKSITWETSINTTIFRNKLVSFPGFETSTYANQYVIGEPLNVRRLFKYTGIDPTTGIYQFLDVNEDGRLDINDRVVNKTASPSVYGGWANTFSYGKFSLDIFAQFAIQKGYGMHRAVSTPPGYNLRNRPKAVLDRWQKEEDSGRFQRYVAQSGTPAYTAANTNIIQSDAIFVDASFIRLKNLAFSYRFEPRKQDLIKNMVLAVRAQNLFTWTNNYDLPDPETQEAFVLPPLKTFSLHLKLTI